MGQEAEQLIAAAAGQGHGPAGADRPIYLRAIKPPDASGGFFYRTDSSLFLRYSRHRLTIMLMSRDLPCVSLEK
ncbi:hypothetical protein QWC_17727 [Achromobacter marplatensis]|nr:hypothetical protein QWC_17727 [Achromobacter marplatensis]